MAKKNKKKRRGPKKKTSQTPPAKIASSSEQQKQKESRKTESLKKSPKKILLYILPFVVLAVGVILIIVLTKTDKSKLNVIRDSELNVLLITLDTTRADRIGVYGYAKAKTPNLDTLAQEGIMFTNAYCQVPLTLPSHVSILTGTYPIYHHVHNNGYYYLNPDLVTVAEIFKQNGFHTSAFIAAYALDSSFGVDKGFDLFDDNMAEDQLVKVVDSERTADKVFEAFFRWFDENHAGKFFSWVHFFDPHSPYVPPSPYREEFANSPYDGEIAFMDFYVGKVVEKLMEKDVFDKTLILIAGDHGEALGDHGEIDHGLFLYESTMKVPFIISAKGHLPSGLVVDSAVRLIDIMPSLLDMAHIQVPEEIQGKSLLPFMIGQNSEDLPSYIETIYPRENYGWSELIGLIDDGWKYIQAPKLELYNLKEDPAEMRNLVSSDGQKARSIKEKLERLIADKSSKIDASRKNVSQDELARLRSLGYIGGGTTERTATKLSDPKDRIDEYKKHYQARQFEERGDYLSAAGIYEEILEKDPDFEWTLIHLARMYTYLNRNEDCFALLEEASKKNPRSFLLLSSLAKFYTWALKPEKAFEASQAALRLNPQYLDGWILSAMSKFDLGEYRDAVGFFEKALELEPENKLLRIKYAYSLGVVGRTNEALGLFNGLHEEYPNDAKVFSGLGLAYKSIGEIDKAREYLKQAVELDPSPKSYLDYATILEGAGDLKEAIRYIKLYLETSQEGDTPQRRKAQYALTEWQKRIK